MALTYAGLDRRWSQLGNEFLRRLSSTGATDSYILGREVDAFEEEFAAYVGSKYCVGVGNGLDALRLALQSSPLPKDARVGVPAETFVASYLAVLQAGLHPVPIDVNVYDGLLDLRQADQTHDLAALMLVHLHGTVVGSPVDSESPGGPLLVEDAAQAHGARSRTGPMAGAIGSVAAFSFYPTKNLGALGDAGAVTTDSEETAQYVRSLRSYGGMSGLSSDKQAIGGWNSRLDTVQAIWLRLSLPHLETWNSVRRDIAREYSSLLRDYVEVDHVDVPKNAVFHHFVVHVPERDRVQHRMQENGVPTEVHYRIPAYRHPSLPPPLPGDPGSEYMCPAADRRATTMLSLPIHPWMTESEVRHVAQVLIQSLPDDLNIKRRHRGPS